MSKKRRKTFRGHGRFALYTNLHLGLMPLWLLSQISPGLENSHNSFLWKLNLLALAIFFSQPTYLFFEIKHLIQKDGIAEKKDFVAILVFGGLSLTGLVVQVVSIIWLINTFHALATNPLLTIITLSFLSAFGGVLGLMDLPTLLGFVFPPFIVSYGLKLLKDEGLVRVTIGTTLLLSVLTAAGWFLR